MPIGACQPANRDAGVQPVPGAVPVAELCGWPVQPCPCPVHCGDDERKVPGTDFWLAHLRVLQSVPVLRVLPSDHGDLPGGERGPVRAVLQGDEGDPDVPQLVL